MTRPTAVAGRRGAAPAMTPSRAVRRWRGAAPASLFLVLLGCGPRPAPAPARPVAASTSQPAAETRPAPARGALIASPAAQPASPLKLPRLRRFALKNGLSVLLLPDHVLPLVDVRLLVRVGSIADPADKVGLAEFVAAMLRHGTRRASADQISQTVDAAGAGLGASAGYEVSDVHCRGRRKSTELCLQLVAELATTPSFPESEMAEIRDKLLTSVKNTRDDPEQLAAAHFDNLLYGDDHPAGRPMTEATVQRIRRRDLVEFHRQHFVPGEAFLAVAGDIDVAQIERAIEKAYGAWRGRPAPRRPLPRLSDPPAGLRVLLVDKPDLTQSFFALGHAGIPRLHPERDAVSVVNYVLGGGGFSSRLMAVVRAQGGKTYGISSHFFRATDDGSFSVESFTRNAELVATLGLVRRELQRMIEQPPTDAERRAAQGKLAGGYAIQLKTPASVADRLLHAQIFGLPDTEVTEHPVRIERLSGADLARAARAHLRPGRLVSAVVGKASEVAPLLKAAGIAFEQVSYLDPISQRERQALAARAIAPISDVEQQRARAILTRALAAAGGRARLAAIRTLRLKGTAVVESKGQSLSGEYTALLLLPDHMRLALALKPVGMVQVLAGERAFLRVASQTKALPPHVVTRWKAVLWREPILVTLHALASDVRSRPSTEPDLLKSASSIAVDVFPPGLPSATLVFDRRTLRLVEIRHVDQIGQTRTSQLGEHRPVQGILVPHSVSAKAEGRVQSVLYKRVEINPPLSPVDFN